MEPFNAMLQDTPPTWGAKVAPLLVTLLLILSGVAHLLDAGAGTAPSINPGRVERAVVCLDPPGWLTHCGAVAIPGVSEAVHVPAPVDTQS